MIPRYQPDVSLAAWQRWLLTKPCNTTASIKLSLLEALNSEQLTYNFAFPNARQALLAYFQHLKHTCGLGNVLVSAQICPIVSYVIQAAGFSIRFVDSDTVYPTPTAWQYQQAIDKDTIAIVIAPLYGHIQTEWSPLLQNLGEIKLVLDLAQGLLLPSDLISSLYQQAAAVIYSFGLGKGLDTGGALMLSTVPLNDTKYATQSYVDYLRILLQVLILQVFIKSGLYPFVINRVETEVETIKSIEAVQTKKQVAPESIYLLWEAKFKSFGTAVERARQRAVHLSQLASIQQACPNLTFFTPQATHLRQIIRFRDSQFRDRVLDSLQRLGVDCAPAGEPLPNEYFDSSLPIFPNAQSFRQETIRLPFLGRLSEAQFKELEQKLEATLVQHLSKRV